MILTGLARLGRDAEVRYTQSGDPVASLALAISYGKRADNKTQWVDASLWGERAEKLQQYLTKGTAVCVVLSDPHIEEYEGKNGKGFSLRATVSNIEFAGGKNEHEVKPSTNNAQPAAPARTASAPSADFDDDSPF